MSRPLNKKRSSSSLSYTQSVKEGLNPPQYTPGYEEVLQDAGICMNEELGQTISDKSQELCDVLLSSFFPPPSNSLFAGRTFLLTLDEARNENEPRVQRDITPLLVPCASLLYLHDRILQCQHLSAKIQSEWTKVTPLAGPLPTPDYVVGLKRSAFTPDERLQLQIYSAPNKATIFRDGLFFPFLVCEVSIDRLWHVIQTDDLLKVKCGENGLSIAERQSMHVASVAANAIIELFRDRAVSRVKELDREILVFSVSHDHVNVKIHGHYARIEGDKITLHRHLMREFGLRDQNGREKWTTYHVVRKIYDYFVPAHLERIRGAIAQLSVGSSFGMSSASLESNSGGDKETESAEGAPSSQGTDRAKKPRLKPTAVLQKENDYLKEQLAQERQQAASNASTSESKLQRELERQREDNQRELEQQREDNQRELEQQREDNQREREKQREDNQRELEQQREDNQREREKQREDNQREREKQREEFKEQLDWLKEQLAQERQSANSGNDSEVVKMLRQQNAEMKEQMDRQRQENQGLKEEISKLTQSVLAFAAQSQPKGRGKK